MEKIVINNLSKEWLKCIDILDYRNLPIGVKQDVLIPPFKERTIREGKDENKITIQIGISILDEE